MNSIRHFAPPETGLDAAGFIERCGEAFSGDGITLTTGLASPDYVLTVAYREYDVDGETHGSIAAVLGFTGGTIGEAKPLGGIDVPIMGHGQVLGHDGYFGSSTETSVTASHGVRTSAPASS